MAFLTDENLYYSDDFDLHGIAEMTSDYPRPRNAAEGLRLVADKLRIPDVDAGKGRPRLKKLLRKSTTLFHGTLISGRTGTGKTTLAAAFAKDYGHTAWYSVESPDMEWNIFSEYFAACLLGDAKWTDKFKHAIKDLNEPTEADISQFLHRLFLEMPDDEKTPSLIVLDDIHHLFDADWFSEFFPLLLFSLPEHIRLLLLCRGRPPNPLWRLRSKQVLYVIDEKLLALNETESKDLLSKSGLSADASQKAIADSFGRMSALLEIVRKS